jgi:uncharacterized protein
MHRDAGHIGQQYDISIMKAAIARAGGPFHLFGGEPLLMDEANLEGLFAWGLKQYQSNGIQTNGVLLNENHLRIFKKYNVQVGVSIDGPDSLNDARWAGTLERTRAATEKTEQAIETLCHAGIIPGVMVQLTRCNAVGDRLIRLCSWINKLDRLGIRYLRLHILEIENEGTGSV